MDWNWMLATSLLSSQYNSNTLMGRKWPYLGVLTA